MSARDVRKNLNAFVDGRGYAGQLSSFTPPALTLTTEDFRGGGMNAATEIEMGMERLEGSMTFIAYDRDVLALWGVGPGREVPFTVREALESADGTVKAVVHTMRGKIRSFDSGEHSPGEVPSLTIELALNYYRHEHDGVVLHEIDVPNMVQVVNGVDRLAAQRQALGI